MVKRERDNGGSDCNHDKKPQFDLSANGPLTNLTGTLDNQMLRD